jgi:hypothetical protein
MVYVYSLPLRCVRTVLHHNKACLCVTYISSPPKPSFSKSLPGSQRTTTGVTTVQPGLEEEGENPCCYNANNAAGLL